jgi:hypothetical protein
MFLKSQEKGPEAQSDRYDNIREPESTAKYDKPKTGTKRGKTGDEKLQGGSGKRRKRETTVLQSTTSPTSSGIHTYHTRPSFSAAKQLDTPFASAASSIRGEHSDEHSDLENDSCEDSAANASEADEPPSPVSLKSSSTSQANDQRARNRVAATKCRAKTKAAIEKLEADERDASSRREALTAYAAILHDEIYRLRHELFRHNNCNCVLIQQYLRYMAGRHGRGDNVGADVVGAGTNAVGLGDGTGQLRPDYPRTLSVTACGH